MIVPGAGFIIWPVAFSGLACDPYWSNCVLAMHMANDFVDLKGNSVIDSGGVVLDGNRAYFDGVNDQISIANASSLNFGTGDFTIEWWGDAAVVAPSGWRGLINKRNPSTYEAGCWGISFSDTSLTWQYQLESVSGVPVVATTTSVSGDRHYAVSRASGMMRLFIDGEMLESFADTKSYTNTYPILIMRWTTGGAQYGMGYIKDLKITTSGKYTETFTPPTAPFADVACV